MIALCFLKFDVVRFTVFWKL